MGGFARARLVFGVSALCGGFGLSYSYFALGVGFGHSALCGGFVSKMFASAIWYWVPPKKKRKTRLWEILPIPSKWAFVFAKTYLLCTGTPKKLHRTLPIPSKCVSKLAKTDLPGMGAAKSLCQERDHT